MIVLDHLKKKKFVVLCMCMGFFVLTSLGFTGRMFFAGSSDEEVITKTFFNSGAKFQGLTIRGWTQIEYRDYGGDPSQLLQQRAASLFPAGVTSTKTTSDDGLSTLTIQGHTTKDVRATLTFAEQTLHNKDAYVILSIESSNLAQYRLMEEIYNKIMRDKTNKSIVIYGYIDKKLGPLETDNLVKKMIKSTKLHNVQTMAERGLVSVSGCSPNVRNVLTPDGNWVNINMALRYNSLDKRTMVYVGAPVITIDY